LFKLFKVGRFKIYANFSFVIGFLFFAYAIINFFAIKLSFYPKYLAYTLGFVTTAFLYLSIVLHELGHSIVAVKNGVPVKKITLFILGAMAHLEKLPENPKTELKIAVAGPLVNFAIALVLLPFVKYLSMPYWLWFTLFYLMFLNVLLGAFNLLPAFPMDGGRIFKSIIWIITKNEIRASKIAVLISRAIALAFIVLAIIDWKTWLWFGFIALFIIFAGNSEMTVIKLKSKLMKKKAKDVMTPIDKTSIEDEKLFFDTETDLWTIFSKMQTKKIFFAYIKNKNNQVVGYITFYRLIKDG